MPADDTFENDSGRKANGQPVRSRTTQTPTAQRRSLFSVPEPIKRIFDLFPLVTYPSNGLPARTPKSRAANTLYVFTTEEDAHRGLPSFNPTCLKWQALLTFQRIPHILIPSNNHSSPTGALPFLLPSPTPSAPNPSPIPASKLLKHFSVDLPPASARQTAYTTLLSSSVRPAYLYSLYLVHENFSSVAVPFYIAPSTTSTPVRVGLAYTLRNAAHEEIVKASPTASTYVDPDELYINARKAFEALETLLGNDEWFLGAHEPGEMDAEVWAYTYVILGGHDKELPWKDVRLKEELNQSPGLVRHAERCLERFQNMRKEMDG